MIALYKGAYTLDDFDYLIAILRGVNNPNACTTSCYTCKCRRACADVERLLKYSARKRHELEVNGNDK